VRGDALVSSVNGGLTRSLDRTNTITWTAGYNSTTYSPTGSGATPNSGISTSLALSHRVSAITSSSSSVEYGWLIFDDATETKTMYWRAISGINSQLSPRLNVHANAGVSSYTTTKDNPLAALAPTNPLTPFNIAPAAPGTTLGPIVDVGFSYRLLKRTDLTASVSYATSQGALGDLSTRFNIAAGISHGINERSSLVASATFSHLDASSAFEASDFYTGSLAYTYNLTKNWVATATYIYRLRQANTGNATSNGALFVVSRDMTLKP
jgi:outer membrane protein W